MTPLAITQLIQKLSQEAGFDATGVARAEILTEESTRLKHWISLGNQASMGYLSRDPDKRTNPEKVLENAKSIVVFLASYRKPHTKSLVSEYGCSRDYHVVIKEKIEEILNKLKAQIAPEFSSYVFCDSSSVMEKAWAIKAGLGVQGKNCLVIHPELGSKFFIGGFITNLEAEPTTQTKTDICKNCRLCIDACPTQALSLPGILDARKCISYHTIENKGAIPEGIQAHISESIFGCDICQNVCPWNLTANKTFTRFFDALPYADWDAEKWSNLSSEDFEQHCKETPLYRTGVEKITATAKLIVRNKS